MAAKLISCLPDFDQRDRGDVARAPAPGPDVDPGRCRSAPARRTAKPAVTAAPGGGATAKSIVPRSPRLPCRNGDAVDRDDDRPRARPGDPPGIGVRIETVPFDEGEARGDAVADCRGADRSRSPPGHRRARHGRTGRRNGSRSPARAVPGKRRAGCAGRPPTAPRRRRRSAAARRSSRRCAVHSPNSTSRSGSRTRGRRWRAGRSRAERRRRETRASGHLPEFEGDEAVAGDLRPRPDEGLGGSARQRCRSPRRQSAATRGRGSRAAGRNRRNNAGARADSRGGR